MNYAAHYKRLTERAATRTLTGYTERHHIIPRCLGGGDYAENLVYLTAEEHYVAHQLLVKINPGHVGLMWAALRLSRKSTGNKAYGWLRRALSEKKRGSKRPPFSAEWRANIGNAHRGKKIPKEVVAKMLASRGYKPMPEHQKVALVAINSGNKYCLGRKYSPESIKKMSESARRRGFSQEHREKLNAAHRRFRGIPLSAEHREKIGAAQRGKPKGKRDGRHAGLAKGT